MLATFLIGLREGLEAALVVGILVAYLKRMGRSDVLPRLWIGVALAIVIALGVGAVLTYGDYMLTFQGQEIFGGVMSLLAVAMVTWMIFWMQKAARHMKAALHEGVDKALHAGSMWALVAVGFVAVAREGIESALLLWSMTQSFGSAPQALTGAVGGIALAAVIGWLLARGALTLNLRTFFAWTGGFLVVVAAGVLAYAIMDLQEAGVVPGPFSALAPVGASGAVLTGWAGLPFGWAFDVSAAIAPGGTLATLLQGIVGFMPRMTWMQVIAWAVYLIVVGRYYLHGLRGPKRSKSSAGTAVSSAASLPASPSEA